MRGSLPSAADDGALRISETGRKPRYRVGQDPISPIHIMEDHDGAYHAWKRAGVRDRILVHLDAHLDFDWIADRDPTALLEMQSLREVEQLLAEGTRWNLARRPREELIDIGNYLYPTLNDGLVRSVYWVVPDGVMESRRQRKALEGEFRGAKKKNPRGLQDLRWENGRLLTRLCGRDVTMCRLQDLPSIQEPVLLNIDTDYFVIDSMCDPYPFVDPRARIPWIWPEELVERLAQKCLFSDLVTIAYSVNGGYTPLAFKFLADDLARLLKGLGRSEEDREVTRTKQEAVWARQQGKIDEAIRAWERARGLGREEPSIHYNLAELCYERGWADRAADYYRRAVEIDPSYRVTEDRLSPVFHLWGLRERARAEYEKALVFDPTNADAHAGLGGLLAHQGEWDRAVSHYQKALAIEPAHPKAHYALGYLYAKQGQRDAAERELTQACGSKDYEGLARFWLGYVYRKTRRWDKAIAAYEAAIAMRIRNLPLHWNLGGLYLRSGRFHRALRQYRRALRMLPSVPLLKLRHLAHHARNVARRVSSEGLR